MVHCFPPLPLPCPLSFLHSMSCWMQSMDNEKSVGLSPPQREHWAVRIAQYLGPAPRMQRDAALGVAPAPALVGCLGSQCWLTFHNHTPRCRFRRQKPRPLGEGLESSHSNKRCHTLHGYSGPTELKTGSFVPFLPREVLALYWRTLRNLL